MTKSFFRWSKDGGRPVLLPAQVKGPKVTPFSPPDDCLCGYYLEMNPLIPLSLHDQQSKTPPNRFRGGFGHPKTRTGCIWVC